MVERRRLLGAAAAAAAFAVTGRRVAANALEHLSLFVPAAPGGGWDQTAHAMENALKQSDLVRRVHVVNSPGDRGLAGLKRFTETMTGRPDSLMVTGLVMINAIAAGKSSVTLADLTPVARLAAEFQMITVAAESKITSLAELGVALTTDIGAVVWTGGPVGGTDHILAGLFGRAAGIDLAQLRYAPAADGAPIAAAVLNGSAHVAVGGLRDFAADIGAGRLRALAISSRNRRPGLDVPTMKEAGFDVELVNWRGVFAAPRVEPAALTALAATIDTMAKSLAWHDEVARRNWVELYQTGETFARFVANESTRIGEIIRRLGLAS